jgi:hypothetical protein
MCCYKTASIIGEVFHKYLKLAVMTLFDSFSLCYLKATVYSETTLSVSSEILNTCYEWRRVNSIF